MLDGDPPLPLQKGGGSPNFRPVSIVAKQSPILATAEHLRMCQSWAFHVVTKRQFFTFISINIGA